MNVPLRRSLRESKALSLLMPALHATGSLSNVGISQDDQIKKLPPDKCALSRAEGHFYASLSLSDRDVEGQICLFTAVTVTRTVSLRA